MPSFISNFKQRLRLPRMFFRRPTREEQIHGGPPLEFERPIPPAPWRGIAVVITIVVIVATALWELYARAWLRADFERQRRSLDKGAPKSAAGITRHRRRFARLV